MGGTLAQPSKSFPSLFPPGTLFDRFPFLLPNLVCTLVLIVGVSIGVLFLEETHEIKRDRRDVGLEVGAWLLRAFKLEMSATKTAPFSSDKTFSVTSTENPPNLMDEEVLPEYSPADGSDLPGYRTTDGTPRQSSSRSHSPSPRDTKSLETSEFSGVGSSKAFNKQVILAVAAFGLLA